MNTTLACLRGTAGSRDIEEYTNWQTSTSSPHVVFPSLLTHIFLSATQIVDCTVKLQRADKSQDFFGFQATHTPTSCRPRVRQHLALIHVLTHSSLSRTQVADCTVKLLRADKLIGGLGGERLRWQATVKQLAHDLINVIGDVVISAGCIAYSGPFTPVYRTQVSNPRN